MKFATNVVSGVILTALASLSSPVRADDDFAKAFDACVVKLCISADQMNCWVKSTGEICDDQGNCRDLPDHAGARILDKRESEWRVETRYGIGWVSNRYMMVSSDLCPGL